MHQVFLLLVLSGWLFCGNECSGQSICKTSWVYHENSRKCYVYLDAMMPWMAARRYCLSYSADLAIVPNEEINRFLFDMQKTSTDAWIGLNDRDQEGNYTWNNHFSQPEYFAWKSGENSNSGRCVAMTKKGDDPIWQMMRCQYSSTFFCEMPRADEISTEIKAKCEDETWWRHGPSQRCMKTFEMEKTWNEARRFCEDVDGELANLDGFDIHDSIAPKLRNARAYWFGTNDRIKAGKYTWLNSTEPVKYMSWKPSYPQFQDRHCVAISTDGRSNPFVNRRCSERLFFVCQKFDKDESVETTTTAATTTTTTTTTTEAPFSCPDDTWQLYEQGDKCMKVVERRANWQTARQRCQDLGGDLVTIPDPDTHDFIRGMMGNKRYWIGLTDFDADGHFNWLNESTETQYHDWANKPMNRAGSEFCVELIGRKNGKWNDKRCRVRRSYICQYTQKADGLTARS